MHASAASQQSLDPPLGRLHLRARLIAGLARAQLGLVGPRDIVALKLSRSAIARRLASGAWRRVFPGVYAVEESPETPLQLRKAAQLWAGEEAALSHRSALEAHGLGAQFDAIEVCSTHRRTAPPGVRHHHVRHLPHSHVAQVQGVAVTTVERTLVDMAALLTSQPDELQALLDECLHRAAPW
jgi:predicted transcriptional regulator of viral defense system